MGGHASGRTGGLVDRWTGLTAMTLVALIAACGGREKAPAAGDSAAANSSAPNRTTPNPAPANAAAADTGTAPDSFRVAFETTRGKFIVAVNRAWAPIGVDRFYRLVEQHYYDGNKFFRVVPDFVAQFGLNGDPKVSAQWDNQRIADDSVRQQNKKYTLTFASMMVPNTRSDQMFFNLKDNLNLDRMGFAPIGVVVQGQAVVDSLYSGYGETPDQGMIHAQGNEYLDHMFPKLDAIKSARIVTTK